MDAPIPINNNNRLIFSFNIEYNNINYHCSIIKLGEENYKFFVFNEKDKENGYEKELTLSNLKKMNKYFKMFDNSQEFENDLVILCKNKKIQILNKEKENLALCIDVLTIQNNKIIFDLNKVELSDKEKLKILILENKEIQKELKNKDLKICELEKKIENLEKKNIEFEKRFEQLSLRIEEINKLSKKQNDIKDNKIDKSNIFEKKEIDFILKEISPTKSISLTIIFNSQIDGDNINKLESSYLNKNNLLFVIKTKKNKRFGGFCSEKFEKKEFQKHDSKAFLFNIDDQEICKVKKDDEYSIWREDNNDHSIRFGSGTDLRILENFLTSEKNYTSPSSSFLYREGYNLSNVYFGVSNLEIFQVEF